MERVRSEAAGANDAAILHRRARALATPLSPVPEAPAPGDQISCLVFRFAGQPYAIDAAGVQEAVFPGPITPLPGLPGSLVGLANVRSRIVPVFDLRALLLASTAPESAAHPTLLIAVFEDAEFGWLVDDVEGVTPVLRSRIRREVAGLQSRFLLGIAEGGVPLLDPAAVVAAFAIEERPTGK